MRRSSSALQQSLNAGLVEAGLDVVDLGMCATEIGSFASNQEHIEAALIVTASHNAPEFNGFKCILSSGIAVTYATGLVEIEKLMGRNYLASSYQNGSCKALNLNQQYIDFLHSKFAPGKFPSGRMALNGLNGTAATLAHDLAQACEFDICWFRKEPGSIPAGGADPADPQLAAEMQVFMTQNHCELGVAWDADCDRCVFFDDQGQLIPAYYMVGLLAEHMLRANPGAAIVYDTKLCFNTLDVIRQYGGIAVPSETGHAYMKQKMRESQAVYGGELSSHHYFSDFYYCDSGMLAWLKTLEVLQQSQRSLAELVETRRRKFQCTPEISLKLDDTDRAFDEILVRYGQLAETVDRFDGLSFEMPGNWRFSLRRSKTEPLTRLNIESKSSSELVIDAGASILDCLMPFKAEDTDWHARLVLQ